MAVSGLIFGFGPFQFDPKLLTLTREGNTVQLTPKVADLLERLASAPGEVLSKETLLASVWPDTFVEEGTLTFHIHALRQALGDEAARPRFVQTVPRRGYRFIASVREIARESGALTTPSERPEVTGAPIESDGVGDASGRPQTAGSLGMPNDAGYPPESRRREPLTIGIKTALIVLGSLLGTFVIGDSIQANVAPGPHVAAVRRLTFDRREKGAYYLELGDGRLLIDVGAHQFVLSLDGTGHLAKSPFEPFHLIDVSAVRGEALANRRDDAGDEMGLWMVSLTGGNAKRVGEVRSNAASWSHNGEWIAYTDGEHALYVTDATGTAVRRLATFSGSPGPPLWSPNDKVIRIRVSIASDRQFRSGVIEVPLDGSSSREVIKVPESDVIWNGGWLSDSSYLYCGKTTNVGCLPMTLSGHESETGGEVSGAPLSPIRFQTLSVSLDGQRIYGTVTSPSQLSRYDGDRQTFEPYLDGVDVFAVDSARSGNWLVYITDADRHLVRADRDGEHARLLTPASFHVDAVAIRPDGQSIAVRGGYNGGHMKIFLIPASGGIPTPIVPGDVEQGAPTWSPDGTKIAFGDVPETYGVPSGNEHLHIYDLRSGRLEDVAGSAGLWSARWSPDGRYLAATAIVDRGLRMFDFTTGTWRSYDLQRVDNMSWSPDGKYLYCYPEGIPDVKWRRVSVPDGAVDMKLDVTAVGQTDGGVAPDGSPLFLVSRSDIYELDVPAERCGLFGLIHRCSEP